MFVGRSPEEQELAGEEEVGFSLGTFLRSILPGASKTALDVAKSPLGIVFAPAAAIATQTAEAVQRGLKGPTPTKPAAVAKVPTKAPTGPSPAAAQAGMAPSIAPPSPPTTQPGEPVIAGHYYTVMGANAPMTDVEIIRMIKREPNAMKRSRMIMNFERARMRR